MGDTPAPVSKRNDSSVSDRSASPESHTKLNASTVPPTDDIDSEWPSDEEPAKPAVATAARSEVAASAAPVAQPLDEVDSGWGNEAEESASALSSPTFPADPALPRDLRSATSDIPSSRPAPVAEVPPSKREMDTVPAAPQASRPPGSVRSTSSARLRAASEAQIAEVAAASVRAPIISRSEPAPTPASSAPREASADARSSFDPHVHAPARGEGKGGSRAPILLALCAAAGIALWLLRPAPETQAPAALSAKTSPAVAEIKQPAAVAEAKQPAAPPSPAAEQAAAPPASEPAAASAAPIQALPAANAQAATAEPTASAAPPSPEGGEPIRVVISVKPPQARLFYRGKEVGHPPVTVEIEPGKRRSYEVALPGFMTRKVVIDGSKTEVQVGLRPDPAASTP